MVKHFFNFKTFLYWLSGAYLLMIYSLGMGVIFAILGWAIYILVERILGVDIPLSPMYPCLILASIASMISIISFIRMFGGKPPLGVMAGVFYEIYYLPRLTSLSELALPSKRHHPVAFIAFGSWSLSFVVSYGLTRFNPIFDLFWPIGGLLFFGLAWYAHKFFTPIYRTAFYQKQKIQSND